MLPTNLLWYDAVQIFLLSMLFLGGIWLAKRSISHGEQLIVLSTRLSHIEDNDLHEVKDRLRAVEEKVGIVRN